MCAECPVGTIPINDTLLVEAQCGQHWCVSEGNWKAVSRVRYQAELEVQRLKREAEEAFREAARALLLGPDNISSGKIIDPPRGIDLIHPGRNKIENEMFCPWLEDWPEEAPFEWTVTQKNTIRFRWQSPLVGIPGVSTAWYECFLPEWVWREWWERLGPRKYLPRYPPVGLSESYEKVVVRAYE